MILEKSECCRNSVGRRRVSICRSDLVQLLGLMTCGVCGIGQVAKLHAARAVVRLTRIFLDRDQIVKENTDGSEMSKLRSGKARTADET